MLLLFTPRMYSNSKRVKQTSSVPKVGDKLTHGTTIQTNLNSHLTLLFTNGALVRLDENTQLILSAFWQNLSWDQYLNLKI